MKEKLLEEREQRLRVMEMELISTSTKFMVSNTNYLTKFFLKLNKFKQTVKEHDVNTWAENDVYEWVKRIGQKNEQGFDNKSKSTKHN